MGEIRDRWVFAASILSRKSTASDTAPLQTRHDQDFTTNFRCQLVHEQV